MMFKEQDFKLQQSTEDIGQPMDIYLQSLLLIVGMSDIAKI